jgi:hypothetical protein
MDVSVMFVDCPEYMDSDGAARCGLPAAVEYRYTVSSTNGPLESAKIRCPRGHSFNGPLDSLTWEKGQTEAALSEQSIRSGVRSAQRWQLCCHSLAAVGAIFATYLSQAYRQCALRIEHRLKARCSAGQRYGRVLGY